MTTRTPVGLVAHARTQLGLPYWYGTFGNKPTAELADQKRKQYPQYWTPDRLARAKATQLNEPRVYDCAGLVKSYWMQETPTAPPKYIAAKDQSAHGLYQCCKASGKIGTLPMDTAGALVFIYNNARGCMSHVGVYDGNGRVIEAKGFSSGVVEGPLDTNRWTHWGLLDWLDYTTPKRPMEKPHDQQGFHGPKEGRPTHSPSVGVLTLADLRVKPGDRVRIKDGTEVYWPGGPSMPKAAWFWKDPVFQVEKISADGRTPNIKGGEPCVLLGEGAGTNIGTWCALKFLEKVED